MYNLNYTYLTQLEVDTRQTFADISDDLILLNHNDNLEKTSAKTLISCWQNFFWESPIDQKENLNVIFTDLSVDHSSFISDDDTDLDDNDMVTIGELTEFFEKMDHSTEAGKTGKWCGKWSFDNMIRELSSAINHLHRRLGYNQNLYPTGSIVVNDNNPSGGDGFGIWSQKNSSYLSENIKSVSEISMGFNNGRAGDEDVGSNLANVVVTPDLKANGIVPTHKHQLKFIPDHGSGNGTSPEEEKLSNAKKYGNIRAGRNKTTGCVYYSGHNNVGNAWPNRSGLVVANDASSSRPDGGDRQPDFSVSSTVVEPSIKRINVAPKTYPINAKVWERTD